MQRSRGLDLLQSRFLLSHRGIPSRARLDYGWGRISSQQRAIGDINISVYACICISICILIVVTATAAIGIIMTIMIMIIINAIIT